MEHRNKKANRAMIDCLNNKDTSRLGDYVADDCIDHTPPPGFDSKGLKAIQAGFDGFITAFPDMQIVIEDEVAHGENVITLIRWTGTHKGEFAGIPATGKRIDVGSLGWVCFRDGKAIEHWGYFDVAAMMQQLGVTQ